MSDQQQQPVTDPIFGFFSTNTSTGTSSFGAPDQNNAASANAFAFGTPKPATSGFGTFGKATTGFGEGRNALSAGMPAPGTSGTNIHGFNATSTGNAFSGSSPFWKQTPATSFGAAPLGPAIGTSSPAYLVFSEKDPDNRSIILHYQSISAMVAYRDSSLEELRVQEYRRTRKISVPGPFKQKRTGVSDPRKQERLEALLRQTLLEEFVDIRFHIYSAKNSSSGRVMKPRVLRANKAFLARSSKYFLNLLDTDINTPDSSCVVITDDNDVPSNAWIDDYGYESDSDLDDCDELVASSYVPRRRSGSATLSSSASYASAETQLRDEDELSENSAGLVGPSGFVVTQEHLKTRSSFSAEEESISAMSSETAVQKPVDDNKTICRRCSGGRHILVKDSAFNTWYTLLNYLYTDKVDFLPLSSATAGGYHESSTGSVDEPKCSAKSMYRLASKAGLDELREEALAHIRSQLTERNIMKEISCSLVSGYPELLEMELDMLHSFTASPYVVSNFPVLAQRIANKELPHGADIVVGIHTRFLKELYPFSMKPMVPPSSISESPGVFKVDVGKSALGTENENESGPCHVDKRDNLRESLSCTWASGNVPTATSGEGPRRRGKKARATGKRASQETPRESVPSFPVAQGGCDKPEDNEGSAS